MSYLEGYPIREKLALLEHPVRFRSADLPGDREWTVDRNEREKGRLLCSAREYEVSIEYGESPVTYRVRDPSVGSGSVEDLEVTSRGSLLRPVSSRVSLTILLAAHVDEAEFAVRGSFLLLSGVYLLLSVAVALGLFLSAVGAPGPSPSRSALGAFVLGSLLFGSSFASIRLASLAWEPDGGEDLSRRRVGLLLVLGGVLAVVSVTMLAPGRLLVAHGLVPTTGEVGTVVDIVYTVHALYLASLGVAAVRVGTLRAGPAWLGSVLGEVTVPRVAFEVTTYLVVAYTTLWVLAVVWVPPDGTTVVVWALGVLMSVAKYVLAPVVRG